MNDRNETSQISLTDLIYFLSPDGKQELIELVRDARDATPEMLADLKAEFPVLTELLDLVANNDAETAFNSLKMKYSKLPVVLFKTPIIALHGVLRHEIDRPR